MLPLRSAAQSDQAPLIVAAAIASSGVIFICVHARESANGMLTVGDVPGLKSVASATATPASISLRAGGYCFVLRKTLAPGTSVATVSVLASAAMSASE